MFGMGGTMSILYGQITTNRPVKVVSSTGEGKAIKYEMMIDIRNNSPIIIGKEKVPAEGVTGTSIELALQGDYFRASSKIQEYFRQTAVVTPYANIVFIDSLGRQFFYERVTESMPNPPVVTKPHPYGIDVEAIRRLLEDTKEEILLQFMCKTFHRVGENIARNFLEFAGFNLQANPKMLKNRHIVNLVNALHRFDGFLKPDASCLSPLGKEILEAGINKEIQPEFIATSIRPPSAYSGFPFIVEVSIAYGGKFLSSGVTLFRFANRIPLLYDEGNDISWKIVSQDMDWRHYNVRPETPIGIITHVCSTKVPYKTVGKEYLADRPELERELKNAIRDASRKLRIYLSRKGNIAMVQRKMNIYGKYFPLIAQFVAELANEKKLPNYQSLIESKARSVEKVKKVKAFPSGVEKKEVINKDERQATFEEFGKL
jgi:DNA topoisomerase-6 subunit B